MPIPVLSQVYADGVQSVPYLAPVLKLLPWLLAIVVLKSYFNGARNGSERVLHSKVAIVTGGTSGVGAAVVRELASRGAQLILLVKDPSDIFTVDYIEDLRTRYDNSLIYAEKCDLGDLHSVRLFATQFIDNSPPRRLDMVICCAGLMAPPGTPRVSTKDGLEAHWAINYLSHYHLLTLLAPVLRVQPPDRDVRVLMTTCTSHVLGELDLGDAEFLTRRYPARTPWKIYGAAKLALMAFVVEFQRRMHAYKRPDGVPMNVRVFCIDPGFARTPGTRRWLSLGSLWGLAAYLLAWPLWWLVLKDGESAAQSYLAALMSPEYATGEGGQMLRECRTVAYRKQGLTDPALGAQLFEVSDAMIAEAEKRSAVLRKKAELEAEAERKKNPRPESAEQRAERERQDAVRKKNEEILAKRKLMDRLIKEEEEKLGAKLDLPQKIPVPPEMEEGKDGKDGKEGGKGREGGREVVPDSPARNTRSRTAEPAAAAAATLDPPERSETPSKSTRRRTRKA